MKDVKLNAHLFIDGKPVKEGSVATVENHVAAHLVGAGLASIDTGIATAVPGGKRPNRAKLVTE